MLIQYTRFNISNLCRLPLVFIIGSQKSLILNSLATEYLPGPGGSKMKIMFLAPKIPFLDKIANFNLIRCSTSSLKSL